MKGLSIKTLQCGGLKYYESLRLRRSRGVMKRWARCCTILPGPRVSFCVNSQLQGRHGSARKDPFVEYNIQPDKKKFEL